MSKVDINNSSRCSIKIQCKSLKNGENWGSEYIINPGQSKIVYDEFLGSVPNIQVQFIYQDTSILTEKFCPEGTGCTNFITDEGMNYKGRTVISPVMMGCARAYKQDANIKWQKNVNDIIKQIEEEKRKKISKPKESSQTSIDKYVETEEQKQRRQEREEEASKRKEQDQERSTKAQEARELLNKIKIEHEVERKQLELNLQETKQKIIEREKHFKQLIKDDNDTRQQCEQRIKRKCDTLLENVLQLKNKTSEQIKTSQQDQVNVNTKKRKVENTNNHRSSNNSSSSIGEISKLNYKQSNDRVDNPQNNDDVKFLDEDGKVKDNLFDLPEQKPEEPKEAKVKIIRKYQNQ